MAVAALTACTQTGGEHSYGNDMIPTGGPAGQAERSYGNDGLQSAESVAFQAVDARLRYANARIEYDARGCALYQATGPNGRTYQEPLRNPDNTTICRS